MNQISEINEKHLFSLREFSKLYTMCVKANEEKIKKYITLKNVLISIIFAELSELGVERYSPILFDSFPLEYVLQPYY